MIEGHDFLTAHFTNNERTIVESLWVDPETKQIREYTLEAVEGNEDWQALLKHINIDSLHENTFEFIKEERKKFEQDVLEIARREKLIESEKRADKSDLLLEIILQEDVDKELLFKVKLALFEQDKIKNSDDRALKARLRKAATIAEAIGIFSEAWFTMLYDEKEELVY